VTLDGVRYRCAVIRYGQRSVEEYLIWAEVHGTFIDFVRNKYENFDKEPKHVSPALISTGTPVQTSIPLFEAYHIPCNMDPWVHYRMLYGPLVHYRSITEWALCLDCNFKLNHPERLSLVLAMAVAPNSAYLFVAAALTLLQAGDLNTQHRQKYRFGLLVANLMVDISRALVAEKRRIPPHRYNCYATYQVPDEQQYNKDCDRLVLLNLVTPNTKLKSERRLAHTEVCQSLADIFPYVDILGGNHLVAIAGTLGPSPLWVTLEIEVHNGQPITWLLTKLFPNKTERSTIKGHDVLSNATAAIKLGVLAIFLPGLLRTSCARFFEGIVPWFHVSKDGDNPNIHAMALFQTNVFSHATHLHF
jgi:hypothetical protein